MHFIFVGGCERSGTSLLQKVLLAHSKITGGPEFIFTRHIAELYERMSADYSDHYAHRLASFYTKDQLNDAFRCFYAGFFQELLSDSVDACYLAEKTPSNIFVADLLLKLFPDSRFVHLIRDGRDVLASYRDVLNRFKDKDELSYNRSIFRWWNVCLRWNGAVDMHFDLLDDPALAGRYFWLKYEDLLRYPDRMLSELCHFLALEVEQKQLIPETISEQETGVPIDDFWYTREIYRQGFNPNRIERWKRDLGWHHRLIGNVFMAANLQRFGYPIDTGFAKIGEVAWRGLKATRDKWRRR